MLRQPTILAHVFLLEIKGLLLCLNTLAHLRRKRFSASMNAQQQQQQQRLPPPLLHPPLVPLPQVIWKVMASTIRYEIIVTWKSTIVNKYVLQKRISPRRNIIKKPLIYVQMMAPTWPWRKLPMTRAI